MNFSAKKLLLLSGVHLCLAWTAWGADYEWTGAVDANWNDTANWAVLGITPPNIPQPADTVTIPDVSPNLFPAAPSGITLAAITIANGASLTAGNLTVAGDLEILGTGDLILSGNLTLGGNLNVEGTFNLNNNNLTAGGNITNGGTLTGIGLLTLNGGGPQTIDMGTASLGALTAAKTGGTAALAGALTITGNLTVTTGIFDLGGNNLTTGGNITNSGTFNLNGGNVSAASFDNTSGTVVFTGPENLGSITTIAGTVTFTGNSNNLGGLNNFELLNLNGGIHTPSGNVTVTKNLTTAAGSSLNMGGNDLTVGGNITNGGTLTGIALLTLDGGGAQTIDMGTTSLDALTVAKTGGTAALSGSLTITGDLTLTSGTAALSGSLTITGNLTLTNGTLNGGGAAITLGGDWIRTGASFNAGTGTIVFTGGNTINNDNTFNNITCTGTIYFEGGKTQTVSGTFDASGASLDSTSAAKWKLRIAALQFSFSPSTQISNCESENYIGIPAGGAVNGGNNIWVFAVTGDYTWEGTVDGNWDTHGNWDVGQRPPHDTTNGPTTEIIIPDPALYTNELKLNITPVICGKITIKTGAVLDLDTKTFNVINTGGLVNDGTIRLTGAANVTVGGVPPSGIGGTIEYYGAPSPAWVFGDTYTNLTVSTSGSMPLLTGNLSVSGRAALGANVPTTGPQTYTGAVTLGGNVTLTATGQLVFSSTVDGPGALTVSGADVQFDGLVGDNTALSGITAGTAAIYTDAVTTTGDQTYNGPVTLYSSDKSFKAGTARFLGGVNGDIPSRTLTVGDMVSASNVQFGGTSGTLASIRLYGSAAFSSGAALDIPLIQFSGPTGRNHAFTANFPPRVILENLQDVEIDADNILTLDNCRVHQKGSLTLKAKAELVLNQNASWYVSAASPSVISSNSWNMYAEPNSIDLNYFPQGALTFTEGFAGLDGEVIMGNGSVIKCRDFYTQINDPQPPMPATRFFTLNLASLLSNDAVTIETSGNVTLNETLTSSVNITKINHVMTGGNIAVRHDYVPGAPVYLGNLIIGDLSATPQTAYITSNIGSLVSGALPGSVKGDVIIRPVKILTTRNDIFIRVEKNWIQGFTDSGALITQSLEPDGGDPYSPSKKGTFNPGTRSVVEFGYQGYTGAARTFTIAGDTTWYDFRCWEPKAVLLFSNYPHKHTVAHVISVMPKDSAGNTLTNINNMLEMNRLYNYLDNNTPPYERYTPLTAGSQLYEPPAVVNKYFWQFELDQNGGELDLNYVSIYFSFAARRVPLPPPAAVDWRVEAYPYVYREETPPGSGTYTEHWKLEKALAAPNPVRPLPQDVDGSFYNVNWYSANQFYYAYTEDSDGNGRIDRLRLQAAFDVLDKYDPPSHGYPQDTSAFVDFEAAVEGYEIDRTRGYSGYARANDRDNIYIYVRENDHSDTDARPLVRILKNNSLRDQATRGLLIGNPDDPPLRAWDTAPPRINYALTLPGHPQIYFQISEPVHDGDVVLPPLPLDPGADSGPVTPSPGLEALGNTQFLIHLDHAYNVKDLTDPAFPKFRIEGVKDRAKEAPDRHVGNESYSYRFPSPKYPKDWNYSGYESIRGRKVNPATLEPLSPTDLGTPTAPVVRPGGIWGIEQGNDSALPVLEHRVSDVLVSVPPRAVTDTQYFVWPLWAKYARSAAGAEELDYLPDYGYVNPDRLFGDTDSIWDFTGRRFLERNDIVMQSRLNNDLSAIPGITYGFNVPDSYRGRNAHGSVGLWYPEDPSPPPPPPPDFVNLVPRPYSARHSSLLSAGPQLYNTDPADFRKGDFPGNGILEFFYHLSASPSDLFVARLDIAPGTPIPSGWYRRIRPFRFDIHSIIRQRNNATILNNVINPEKNERAYLDYTITSGGRVTVQVFTLDGNLVKVLERGSQSAGTYRLSWDGRNNGGRVVARGMYFIRIVAPDIDEIRKIMVVK